ncbi:MAG TPA: DUF2851 family protein [Balneolaceae bacterium]|nr:DUF2851 family protein [Balneolaceae bacterium]
MDKYRRSYHEGLLHWIWETLHFDYQNLHTSHGEVIKIHQPGTYNQSDGPDFKNAEISIGKLRWFGDVEIHWKFADWHAHGHQNDPNFGNVVLHVVFDETTKTIHRKNGGSIPTLCLSSFISKPLQSFLEHYFSNPQLPCAGHLSFISEKAFERQLEKAHKEYFEQKVDDLLEFYDPALPPAKAWQKMFTIALFDGLGIAHNRAPMQKLAHELLPRLKEISSAQELRKQAIAISEIKADNPANSSWKHKGCRPGNHPLPRIQQAADCLWHIGNLPFEQWLKDDPKVLWKELTNSITISPSLGRERSAILFGTVFLPALYSLGNLFLSERIKSRAWDLWRTHRVPLPPSLLKLLENTSLPPSLYSNTLGTVFQLREYCRPKQCQNCKVFKSAISS